MTSLYLNVIFKIVSLIVLICLFDQAAGILLRTYYFKQRSGLQYRTTYSIEQTKADILFFGSSRSNHHYNPVIFEDSLKLSAYNVGRDGNGLPYHYAVLRSILKRHTPKIVILDLLKDDFEEGRQVYERLSSLLPYYESHPEIRPVINMRSNFERIKLLSAIYPYNSSLVTIAAGNVKINGRPEDVKGYLPLDKVWRDPMQNDKKEVYSVLVDERKIGLFKAFIGECRRHHVELCVIVSPYLNTGKQNKSKTLILARRISDQNKVPFWDYSEDVGFQQSARLFADPAHLNSQGATQYSLTIVECIRRYLVAHPVYGVELTSL